MATCTSGEGGSDGHESPSRSAGCGLDTHPQLNITRSTCVAYDDTKSWSDVPMGHYDGESSFSHEADIIEAMPTTPKTKDFKRHMLTILSALPQRYGSDQYLSPSGPVPTLSLLDRDGSELEFDYEDHSDVQMADEASRTSSRRDDAFQRRADDEPASRFFRDSSQLPQQGGRRQERGSVRDSPSLTHVNQRPVARIAIDSGLSVSGYQNTTDSPPSLSAPPAFPMNFNFVATPSAETNRAKARDIAVSVVEALTAHGVIENSETSFHDHREPRSAGTSSTPMGAGIPIINVTGEQQSQRSGRGHEEDVPRERREQADRETGTEEARHLRTTRVEIVIDASTRVHGRGNVVGDANVVLEAIRIAAGEALLQRSTTDG